MAAAAAADAAARTIAAPRHAGALTAEAIAKATTATLAGLRAFMRTRFIEEQTYVTGLLEDNKLDRDEAKKVLDREREYEREFARRMQARIKRDLPAALRSEDPKAAVASLMDREKGYMRLREEAIAERLQAAVERIYVRGISPEGAYWRLSGSVKEHTPDCLAMGEKFWPWSVLNAIHPPLHKGCPCRLLGLDEATELSLMTSDQIPDEDDAKRRARDIAKQYKLLESLGMTRKDFEDYVVGLALEEAVRGRGKARGTVKKHLLRWPKGFGHGGQFRPKVGGDPGDRLRKEMKKMLPRLPESPLITRRGRRGRNARIRGRNYFVPEGEAWEKTVHGTRYHSPPGSTHVYMDKGARRSEGDRKKAIETRRTVKRVRRETTKARARRANDAAQKRDPDQPPIKVGDPAGWYSALEAAGFVPAAHKRMKSGVRDAFMHPETRATILVHTDASDNVRKIEWEPGRKRPRRKAAGGAPGTVEELEAVLLARAEKLAKHYGTHHELRAVRVDDRIDTSAEMDWDGTLYLGQDAHKGLDALAHPEDNDANRRRAFVLAQVASHETGHAINPTPISDFDENDEVALEEALTEEMTLFQAVDWLREMGREDVVDWAARNPEDHIVRGNYSVERQRLYSLMDRAGVPLNERRELIEDLKYRIAPSERRSILANLIHAEHEDVDLNMAHLVVRAEMQGEFDSEYAQNVFRSAIRPTFGTSEGPPMRPGMSVRYAEGVGTVMRTMKEADGWYAEVHNPSADEPIRFLPASELDVLTEEETLPNGMTTGDTVRIADFTGAVYEGKVTSVEWGGAEWSAWVQTDEGTEIHVDARRATVVRADTRGREMGAQGARDAANLPSRGAESASKGTRGPPAAPAPSLTPKGRESPGDFIEGDRVQVFLQWAGGTHLEPGWHMATIKRRYEEERKNPGGHAGTYMHPMLTVRIDGEDKDREWSASANIVQPPPTEEPLPPLPDAKFNRSPHKALMRQKTALNVAEMEALDVYTSAGGFNDRLRQGQEHVWSEDLDKALRPGRAEVNANVVVRRGLQWLLPMGDEFVEEGFLSTSTDKEIAWSDNFFGGRGDLLEIEVPKGTPGIYMERLDDADTGERELLLGRYLKLRIISRTPRKDKDAYGNIVKARVIGIQRPGEPFVPLGPQPQPEFQGKVLRRLPDGTIRRLSPGTMTAVGPENDALDFAPDSAINPYGAGILFPNGKVWTWNRAGYTASPNHFSKWREAMGPVSFGEADRFSAFGEMVKEAGARLFLIDRTGYVTHESAYGPPLDEGERARIHAKDTRLHFNARRSDRWSPGDVQVRATGQQHYDVLVGGQRLGQVRRESGRYLGKRGKKKVYHWAIQREGEDSFAGRYATRKEAIEALLPSRRSPGYIDWEDQVRPAEERTEIEDWNDWEPGWWGKGIRDANGDWHVWKTKGHGDPHHDGAMEVLDPYGQHVMEPEIVVSPSGFYMVSTQNWLDRDQIEAEYPGYKVGDVDPDALESEKDEPAADYILDHRESVARELAGSRGLKYTRDIDEWEKKLERAGDRDMYMRRSPGDNRIEHTPGRRGKGFLLPDGSVWTWNAGPGAHHLDKLAQTEFGGSPRTDARSGMRAFTGIPEGAVFFTIDEDNTYWPTMLLKPGRTPEELQGQLARINAATGMKPNREYLRTEGPQVIAKWQTVHGKPEPARRSPGDLVNPAYREEVEAKIRKGEVNYKQAPSPALADAMERAVKEREVAVRAWPDSLMGILQAGGFKSPYDGEVYSSGFHADEWRKNYEHKVWNIAEDARTDQHPVYGYMAPVGEMGIGSFNDQALGPYGSVRLILKPDVRKRTTVTSADTLVAPDTVPSPLEGEIAPVTALWYDPDPDAGYIEAQILGGVRAEDIARVTFGWGPPPREVQRALDERGIEWDVDPLWEENQMDAGGMFEDYRGTDREDANLDTGGFDPALLFADEKPAAKAARHRYSAGDVSGYIFGDADRINEYLRARERGELTVTGSVALRVERAIRGIDEMMRPLTDSERGFTGADGSKRVLVRGGHRFPADTPKPGEVYTEAGYMSLTTNPDVADAFQRFAKEKKGWNLVLEVPEGTRGVPIDMPTYAEAVGELSGEEDEVILARGTRYRVTEVKPVERWVRAEVVDQPTPKRLSPGDEDPEEKRKKLEKTLHDMMTPGGTLDPELEPWVEDTPFGMRFIKHPLVVMPYDDAFANHANAIFRQKKEAIERYRAEGNWEGVIWMHERPYRMFAFQQIAPEILRDEDYWRILGELWVDSENIWQNELEWQEALEGYTEGDERDVSLRQFLMDEDERKALDALPAEFDIYRGFSVDDREEGLSWTLNRQRAEWFASRLARPGEVPRVAEARVRKSDVIAHFLGRGEDEIVVLPEDLDVRAIHEVGEVDIPEDEDYEGRHRESPGDRKAAVVEQHIARNGPYLYHLTTPAAWESIQRDGKLQWTPQTRDYEKSVMGRVYLSAPGGEGGPGYRGEGEVLLRIDARKLDPEKFAADEDVLLNNPEAIERFGLPPVEPPDDSPYYPEDPVGAWAENNSEELARPDVLAYGLEKGSVGYDAEIPLDAIVPAPSRESPGDLSADERRHLQALTRGSITSKTREARRAKLNHSTLTKLEKRGLVEMYRGESDVQKKGPGGTTFAGTKREKYWRASLTDAGRAVLKRRESPGDQHRWFPGSQGKGWVYSDGTVETWNTPWHDGRPYHVEVAKGRPEFDPSRKGFLSLIDAGARPFFISEDGNVSFERGGNYEMWDVTPEQRAKATALDGLRQRGRRSPGDIKPYLNTRAKGAWDKEHPWLVTYVTGSMARTERFKTEKQAQDYADLVKATLKRHDDVHTRRSPGDMPAFVRRGRITYQRDKKQAWSKVNYVPDISRMTQPQQSALGTFDQPDNYEAMQLLYRSPELLPGYLEMKGSGHLFGTEGNEIVWTTKGDEIPGVGAGEVLRDPKEIATEYARQGAWLEDAIREHGSTPPGDLWRVSGMAHFTPEQEARLWQGETLTLEEPGFFATSSTVSFAEMVGGQTSQADAALWRVDAGGAKALQSDYNEDEWLFAPGTRFSIKLSGERYKGKPVYDVTIVGARRSPGDIPRFQRAGRKWLNSLGKEELGAIRSYQRSMTVSAEINRRLREEPDPLKWDTEEVINGRVSNPDVMRGYVERIDRALAQAPVVRKRTTVWRGVPTPHPIAQRSLRGVEENFGEWLLRHQGEVYEVPQYLGTSHDRAVAGEWAESAMPVVMEIDVPPGVRAGYLGVPFEDAFGDMLDHERELLFPRGTRLRIDSVDKIEADTAAGVHDRGYRVKATMLPARKSPGDDIQGRLRAEAAKHPDKRVMFHVAPKKQGDSIAEKGLLDRDPTTGKRKWELQDAAVYLFDNPTGAAFWLTVLDENQALFDKRRISPPDMQGLHRKDADVWLVDTTGLEIEPDPLLPSGYYGSYRHRATIGPERILGRVDAAPSRQSPGDDIDFDIEEFLADHPIYEDEPEFVWASRVCKNLPPPIKHEVLYRIREQYDRVEFVAQAASKWRTEHGLPEPQVDISLVRADMPKADKVGRAWEGIEDHSDDPKVIAAFEDFKRQNEEMWKVVTEDLGITVEWVPMSEGEPYQSAEAQADDVRNNRHLRVNTGLGGDHPLLTTEEYDRFRAVHDIFGHVAIGGGFDRHGEYQAWLAHMTMYTGEGAKAMSSEYHGVNSSLWGGDPNVAEPTGKAVLLPDKLIRNPWDEQGRLVRKSPGDQRISPKLARQAKKRVATLAERYPNAPQVNIRAWELPHGFFAGNGQTAFDEQGAYSIKLDPRIWGKERDFDRAMDRHWEAFADPTAEGLVTHEFGHIIHGMLEASLGRREVARELQKVQKEIPNLSWRARENDSEFFAEAFVAWQRARDFDRTRHRDALSRWGRWLDKAAAKARAKARRESPGDAGSLARETGLIVERLRLSPGDATTIEKAPMHTPKVQHAWFPGKPGKGWLGPNGELWTWNLTDSGNMFPAHFQMYPPLKNQVPGIAEVDDHARKHGWLQFVIDEDGTVFPGNDWTLGDYGRPVGAGFAREFAQTVKDRAGSGSDLKVPTAKQVERGPLYRASPGDAPDWARPLATPLTVWRTEKADPAYKGKAVWGEGVYFSMDRQEAADMTLDPHSDTVQEPDWAAVKEHIIPTWVRLLEVDLDELWQPDDYLAGEELKQMVLDAGYDGIRVRTDSLNYGGDQVVVYRNLERPRRSPGDINLPPAALTDDASRAVERVTEVWYQKADEIRDAMRRGDLDEEIVWEDWGAAGIQDKAIKLRTIVNRLNKLAAPTRGDVKLYRGVVAWPDGPPLDAKKPERAIGAAWSDEAFVSSSIELGTAAAFGSSENPIFVLELQVPEGQKVINLTGHEGGENEVLIPGNAEYEVTGVRREKQKVGLGPYGTPKQHNIVFLETKVYPKNITLGGRKATVEVRGKAVSRVRTSDGKVRIVPTDKLPRRSPGDQVPPPVFHVRQRDRKTLKALKTRDRTIDGPFLDRRGAENAAQAYRDVRAQEVGDRRFDFDYFVREQGGKYVVNHRVARDQVKRKSPGESLRSRAVDLYQRLYEMTPEERRKFADEGGGVMAPSGDDLDDARAAARGEKPAALVLGGREFREGVVKALREEGLADDFLMLDHDDEMQSLVVSRNPEAADMLDRAAYHEPRNAWRHVQTGVALGYTDADIARFLSRDEVPMSFEIGNQPRPPKRRSPGDPTIPATEFLAIGMDGEWGEDFGDYEPRELTLFDRGKASVTMTQDESGVHLYDIEIEPKGTGLGGEFVDALKEYADTEGVPVFVHYDKNQAFWDKFPWLRAAEDPDAEGLAMRAYTPKKRRSPGEGKTKVGDDPVARLHDFDEPFYGGVLYPHLAKEIRQVYGYDSEGHYRPSAQVYEYTYYSRSPAGASGPPIWFDQPEEEKSLYLGWEIKNHGVKGVLDASSEHNTKAQALKKQGFGSYRVGVNDDEALREDDRDRWLIVDDSLLKPVPPLSKDEAKKLAKKGLRTARLRTFQGDQYGSVYNYAPEAARAMQVLDFIGDPEVRWQAARELMDEGYANFWRDESAFEAVRDDLMRKHTGMTHEEWLADNRKKKKYYQDEPEAVTSDPTYKAAQRKSVVSQSLAIQSRIAAFKAADTIPDQEQREEARRQVFRDAVLWEMRKTKSDEEWAKEAEEIKKRERAVTETAEPVVRVPQTVLVKILNDGRFRTQHEVERSRGYLGPAYRASAERLLFGLDEDIEPERRIIYGYLSPEDADNHYGMDAEDAVAQYGEVRVVLKRDRPNLTVTFGDSLDMSGHNGERPRMAPSPLADPGPESAGLRMGGMHGSLKPTNTSLDYAEVHAEGPVTLDDIERVDFLKNPPASSVVKKLRAAGIPFTLPNGQPDDGKLRIVRGAVAGHGKNLKPPDEGDKGAIKWARRVRWNAQQRKDSGDAPPSILPKSIPNWSLMNDRGWELAYPNHFTPPEQFNFMEWWEAAPERKVEMMEEAHAAGWAVPDDVIEAWRVYGRGEGPLPMAAPNLVPYEERPAMRDLWNKLNPLQRLAYIERQMPKERGSYGPARAIREDGTIDFDSPYLDVEAASNGYGGVNYMPLLMEDAKRWKKLHPDATDKLPPIPKSKRRLSPGDEPTITRSWHLTADPNFKLDSTIRPWDNWLLAGPTDEPGLYVSEDPEEWFNGYDYVRPFVVEIEHPPIPARKYGLPQGFLPATLYPESRIVRVIPTDEYVRERFHDYGWIEDFMGEDLEGRKLPRDRNSMLKPRVGLPADYRYTGPDVRDMTPTQIMRQKERLKHYIETVRPHMLADRESPGDRISQFDLDPGTVDVGDDVNLAADLLAEGRRVRLAQPRTASVLLDELARRVREAGDEGAPNFDLCKVMVRNTNLFCAESKGVPRVLMPQLSGVPKPGSKAAALADSRGRVDLRERFAEHLRAKGYNVTREVEKASFIRPTQIEMNAAKVAGMTEAMRAGNMSEKALYVSDDNYVLDGHHRWAAKVAIDVGDNKLGDIEMPVERVDIDIITLMDEARAFADEWGIPQADVSQGGLRRESPGDFPPPKPGTVRFYHGTTNVGLQLARGRGAIKPLDPHEIASGIEEEFGLPRDSIWTDVGFSFSRDRSADPNLYLTQYAENALSYASEGNEVVADALAVAHRLLDSGDPDRPWQERHAEMRAFRADWLRKHDVRPVVVAIDLPREEIANSSDYARYQPWGKNKTRLGPEEWFHEATSGGSHPLNTLMYPRDIPLDWIVPGRQSPGDERVVPKPWVEPPPPKGQPGQVRRTGYSTEGAFGTNTAMGKVGENVFMQILGGGEKLHPENDSIHSPLDVRFDGYAFEVKSSSTQAIDYKAAQKRFEQREKEAAAADLGLKGATAIVVLDPATNTAHIYFREGFKSGRLRPDRGWQYLGSGPIPEEQLDDAWTSVPTRLSPGDFGTSDPYVYHLTSRTDLAPFRRAGIRPGPGQSGHGVYLANTPDRTQYHVTFEEPHTLLRIDKGRLVGRFGKYPQVASGVQFDDYEGELFLEGSRAIPPDLIEYQAADGTWKPLVPGRESPGDPNRPAILDFSKVPLTLGKRAGGSPGAHLAEDAEGASWLVKTYGGDQDRVATELAANAVYRALGARVPVLGETTAPGSPDFTKVPDEDIEEPGMMEAPKGKTLWHPAAGVILLDPEEPGTFWLVKPKNAYGGYKATFPKGTVEDGHTLQQTALKELWEESGLHGKILTYLGDYEGDTSTTRYYVGIRTGGIPEADDYETAEVVRVTPKEALKELNRPRDKDIVLDLLNFMEGIPLPEETPADNTPEPEINVALATPMLKGGSKPKYKLSAKEKKALAEHFMVDALLGNWDFAGAWNDNLRFDDGDAIRLDAGSALEYRGQDQLKAFGPVPIEVYSLLAKGQAKDRVNLTTDEMREQAREIGRVLKPSVIDRIMDEAPFADEEMRERVRENLKARVDWMKRFARRQEDIPRPPSGDEARAMLIADFDKFEIFEEEQQSLRWFNKIPNRVAVQAHLRSKAKKEAAPFEVQATVQHLDDILKDARTSEDITVYVGIPEMDPKKADKMVGQTFGEPAYLEATLDEAQARQKGSVIRVIAPERSRLVYLPALGVQSPDILFQRKQRLRIVGSEIIDGVLYLEAVAVA